jgi:hypothetical protein
MQAEEKANLGLGLLAMTHRNMERLRKCRDGCFNACVVLLSCTVQLALR